MQLNIVHILVSDLDMKNLCYHKIMKINLNAFKLFIMLTKLIIIDIQVATTIFKEYFLTKIM